MKRNHMLAGGGVAIGLALLVPITNLVLGTPKGTTLTRMEAAEPELAKAAHVLEARCANCHTWDTKMPFYAHLPVARGMVWRDIEGGRRAMNMPAELYPEQAEAPSQAALAKIEHEVQTGAMPPARYVALHWNGSLTASDKATLETWIKSTRIAHYAPKGIPEAVAAGALHPIPAQVQVDEHGYDVFRRDGCHTCHVGRLLGGQSFELMGRRADYFADRGTPTPADEGRYNATKKEEEDRRHFKVPTLRNVAQTFPYFHDGSATDLQQAARAMAKYQVGEPMSDTDVAAVVKLLEALTGEYRGKAI